jgi:hypothetical protein
MRNKPFRFGLLRLSGEAGSKEIAATAKTTYSSAKVIDSKSSVIERA